MTTFDQTPDFTLLHSTQLQTKNTCDPPIVFVLSIVIDDDMIVQPVNFRIPDTNSIARNSNLTASDYSPR